MEAKDFWCYFWGTRYCYLVVFAEKALNPQYPCWFSPFCALVVFHRRFDWRPADRNSRFQNRNLDLPPAMTRRTISVEDSLCGSMRKGENDFSGYLLDATGYNLLWFDQRSEWNRVYLHRLLSQSVEEFPA